MTRPYNVRYQCQHCGEFSTAENGFCRWMRNHTSLDSVNGIVRTDTDHWILRYKTALDGRDFQLLMLLETKEHGAEPRKDQLDILRFIHCGMTRKGRNMHGAVTEQTFKARSSVSGRIVRVKYLGYHLLQFEKTNPEDGWIKWDRRIIDKGTLLGVLALERNPNNPQRWIMETLRDRHRKPASELILNLEAA